MLAKALLPYFDFPKNPTKLTGMKTLILSLVLLAGFTNAQTPFTGTISNSLGGAGRAAITPEEVAFLNPAALVHQKGYQLSTAYRDFNVREDGSIYDFMTHISENQPDTMFPLALTYHKNRNFYHSANDRSEDFHFTTANMLFDNFSVGFDVRKHKYDGPTEDEDEWDGTVGIMYILTKDLGMGLVHRNLLDSDSPYLYRTLEFGVNYIFEDFLRFVFDVVYGTEKNPDKQAVYMFGVEHKMLEGFRLGLDSVGMMF